MPDAGTSNTQAASPRYPVHSSVRSLFTSAEVKDRGTEGKSACRSGAADITTAGQSRSSGWTGRSGAHGRLNGWLPGWLNAWLNGWLPNGSLQALRRANALTPGVPRCQRDVGSPSRVQQPPCPQATRHTAAAGLTPGDFAAGRIKPRSTAPASPLVHPLTARIAQFLTIPWHSTPIRPDPGASR
jgi:hypothetical protein